MDKEVIKINSENFKKNSWVSVLLCIVKWAKKLVEIESPFR